MSLMKFISKCWDAFKGPRTIRTYVGREKPQQMLLTAEYENVPGHVMIHCREVLYHVVYTRRWIPDQYVPVYEVVAVIPPHLRCLYDPRLSVMKTYPAFVTRGLHQTEYPMTYAVKAFMDQFKVEIET